MSFKEADITYKVRGGEFTFIKLVCLEEKENCSMKVQEVVFGDFKTAEFPKSEFSSLVEKMNSMPVPFPGYSDGKSGDAHQLDIQSGENALNLKWFGDSAGEEWKAVLDFAGEIKALKQKYIS